MMYSRASRSKQNRSPLRQSNNKKLFVRADQVRVAWVARITVFTETFRRIRNSSLRWWFRFDEAIDQEKKFSITVRCIDSQKTCICRCGCGQNVDLHRNQLKLIESLNEKCLCQSHSRPSRKTSFVFSTQNRSLVRIGICFGMSAETKRQNHKYRPIYIDDSICSTDYTNSWTHSIALPLHARHLCLCVMCVFDCMKN